MAFVYSKQQYYLIVEIIIMRDPTIQEVVDIRTCKKILVVGSSGVGKTCLVDMLMRGKHYSYYDPVLVDTLRGVLDVDKTSWILDFMDLNPSPLREVHSDFRQRFARHLLEAAHGIVLLYDITSKESFDYVTTKVYPYAWRSRKTNSPSHEGYRLGSRRFGCILVGNKLDLAEKKREVSTALAQTWAGSQGIKFFEMDTFAQEPIEAAIKDLVRIAVRADKRDKEDYKEWEKGIKRDSRKLGLISKRRLAKPK